LYTNAVVAGWVPTASMGSIRLKLRQTSGDWLQVLPIRDETGPRTLMSMWIGDGGARWVGRDGDADDGALSS
jgi:hypothetical protein